MRKSTLAVTLVALAFALTGPGSAAAAPPAFGQTRRRVHAVDAAVADPGDARRDLHAASSEPVRLATLGRVVRARHVWQRTEPARLPTRLLHAGRRPRRDAERRRDQRRSGRLQPVRWPRRPCDGLNNFWRSLSNLTLNVTLPATAPTYAPENGEDDGCKNSNDLFAVSQASPVRSVIVNGALILQDYCNRGFVSGGFFANDELNGFVGNFGQQQYFTRNSNIGQWSNAVWNQTFLGDNGAPATAFGPGVGQYTNVPSARVSQEPPFLTTDAAGNWSVFLPAVQRNSVGPNYAGGSVAGTSIPISSFFIASPATPVSSINAALARSQNLILTPGIYQLPQPIEVLRPHTVVLGLGFATLIPTNGNTALETSSVPGIKVSGLIVDAGPVNSPVLVQIGGKNAGGTHDPNDPTLLSDVFFRIGGAEPGRATTSLVVNADNAILDDIWAWRADHGAGVGWTQ